MPLPPTPFPPKTDRNLRLAGPFVLFLMGITFFKLDMYLELERSRLPRQFAIALSCGYIGWEVTRLTGLSIQRRWAGLNRFRQRVIAMALSLVVLAHLLLALRIVAHCLFNGRAWVLPTLTSYSDTTGLLIFYTTVILVIYETAYLVSEWKKTALEKERLLQSEWQARYDLLKAQINPHFLFNCLNTLSSLIGEDPQRAEKFADEMSRMYRYLLQSNDQEQVTLGEELRFIRSYAHLLGVRYGEGLGMQVDVSEEYHDRLLPAMTLQLLVENAVKHNAIHRESPLHIRICVNEDAVLMVENNLQRKQVTVPSTGIGLRNIREKFRLMNAGEIVLKDDDGYFRVMVPLLKSVES